VSSLSSVFLVGFLVVAVLTGSSSTAHAEFYKYRDATGGLVITNKLEDVPKKYRKNVKVVWDEELAAKDPLARRMAASEARREQQQKQQPQQQEKSGSAGKLKPSDGKTLVITFDEETGQLIRTME
jgi:hypothetical protein